MSDAFLNILEVSVSMIPVIILIIILDPLFGRIYKSGWKYWLWLGISVRLILPFSFGYKIPALFKLPAAQGLISGNIIDQGVIPSENNLINIVNSSSLSLSITDILAIIYFSVAAIFIIFKLANYIIFRKRIEKWCEMPDEKILEAFSDICKLYGIDDKKKMLRIRMCRKISGPVVLGIYKPVLLLNNGDYDDVNLKMILRHEIVHIKRHDTAYKFFLMLVCAVHWFNPFVYSMSKKACRDLEASCDMKVLQDSGTEEKKLYSLMIIDQASHRFSSKVPSLLAGLSGSENILEYRVKNILNSAGKKEGYITLMLVLTVAIVCGNTVRIGSSAGSSKFNVPTTSEDVTDKKGTGDFQGVEEYSSGVNLAGSEFHEKVQEKDKNLNENIGEASSEKQETDQLKVNESAEAVESAEIVIIDLNHLNDEGDNLTGD